MSRGLENLATEYYSKNDLRNGLDGFFSGVVGYGKQTPLPCREKFERGAFRVFPRFIGGRARRVYISMPSSRLASRPITKEIAATLKLMVPISAKRGQKGMDCTTET